MSNYINIPQSTLVALHTARYQRGESIVSIAKDFNISDVTLRQRFIDAGLPVSRGKAGRKWSPKQNSAAAPVTKGDATASFVGECEFPVAMEIFRTVSSAAEINGSVIFDLTVKPLAAK